jgi:hypothetical protein
MITVLLWVAFTGAFEPFDTNSNNRSKHPHTLSLLASDSYCHRFATDYNDTLPIQKEKLVGIVVYQFCLKFGDCYKRRQTYNKRPFVLIQKKA